MNFIKKKYLLSKCLKSLIKQGKKEKIEKNLKLSISFIKKKKKLSPVLILLDFIKKTQPFCEVKSIKIKGSLQKIPIEIKQNRKQSLILRWLKTHTKFCIEFTLVESLSKELLDSSNYQSRTIKLSNEMHKIAEANKIFTQFKN